MILARKEPIRAIKTKKKERFLVFPTFSIKYENYCMANVQIITFRHIGLQ